MGKGGRTGERLQKVPVKVGNYTLVVNEFDLWVAQIECLCLVYFQYYYLMLPHCSLGFVVSQTAHLFKPYWSSSVEICSSTLYVNQRWW
jgi:hypothetical protein